MSWFDEQIKQRRQSDQRVFEDSMLHIAEAILGQRSADRLGDKMALTKAAIDDVLRFYHHSPAEVPDIIRGPDEQLDYALRPHGLMRRNVRLEKGWHREAFGPMIAYRKSDGYPVALLPRGTWGYYYKDGPQKVRIGAKEAEEFQEDAICFYRPLPQKSLGISDLIIYMKDCINAGDIIMFLVLTLIVTLTGMLLPRITRLLTGIVLPSGNETFLLGTAIFIFVVLLSSQLFTMVKNLLMDRIQTKTDLSVEAAVMMRLLGLPATFFRRFSSGELQSRTESVNRLSSLLLDSVFSMGITSIASLLYIGQIARFTPALVIPAIMIIVVTVIVTLAYSFMQMRVTKRRMELGAEDMGISFSLISGVQKIKLAGAEKRAFARWADAYAETAELTYNPPFFLKINGAVTTAVYLTGTIFLYYMAVQDGVTPSDYIAFSASFGMISGAFMSLAGVATLAAQIKPILEMAEPILKETPEMSEGKEILTRISGSLELSNVYFRYGENMPYVLDGISLKVHSGEYIAVVGQTGCGKSTLVRILLGFEKPGRGAVYYDGKDISSIDLQSLRKRIGVVTQDGSLFHGDIFSNIVISAPWLTLEDAWEAAEVAGIADDIRRMPMGMQTVISEGQGGISGGQKQRIMIARAIAPKPKLLIFDEATSALDNKTQKQISEALDNMGCTRIVIAHRLSTIRHCDRILVMDQGRIIEDGSYDELIARGGSFAELVRRQRMDDGKEKKAMSEKEKELNLEELSNVNGGVSTGKDDTLKKYEELEKAWDLLGFEQHEGTRHQLDAFCDEWAAKNYQPSALQFLTGKKWW